MRHLLARLFRHRPRPDDTRWVVLDVEASGLDMHRDRLLAIAAIGVHFDGEGTERRPRVVLGDSFEVVLRQHEDTAPDKENILLHGIGIGAQRAGVPADSALRTFAAWAGDSPLIAFHAAFDRTLIRRACVAHVGEDLPNPWMDLAQLAEVLMPMEKARSLDDWMARFGIHCAVRHQAAADTLATAELLMKLWPAVLRQGGDTGFRTLATLAAQRRWLPA